MEDELNKEIFNIVRNYSDKIIKSISNRKHGKPIIITLKNNKTIQIKPAERK